MFCIFMQVRIRDDYYVNLTTNLKQKYDEK